MKALRSAAFSALLFAIPLTIWLSVLSPSVAGFVVSAHAVPSVAQPNGKSASAPFLSEVEAANQPQDEQIQAAVYNCNRAEILVVWQVDTGGGDTDLFGRRARLLPGFQWLGGAFVIAATSSPERNAHVAFNPLDDDFLIVYERQLASGDIDVLGQRLSGWSGGGDNGPELKGSAFFVGATVGKEMGADLAFLAATQQFLVAYELDGDVRAQRVARYHQGNSGGELIGSDFIVAADFQRAESEPAVIASSQQAYFLVAYAYEFSAGDFDIRGQRLRGASSPGNELIDSAFDLAFGSDVEHEPRLAYSQSRQAFLAVWTAAAAGNSDVRGKWMDERVLSGTPGIGLTIPIADSLTAAEGSPWVDIDPITGDVAVTLTSLPAPGAAARVGLAWLNPDPLAAKPILRPFALFPDRPFPFSEPRLTLCPNQPTMIIAYNARFGVDPNYQHDVHLLVGGRWGVAMPMVLR